MGRSLITRFYAEALMAMMVGLLGFMLAGCSETGLRGYEEDLGLSKFRDCTTLVEDAFWFEDHEFGVGLFYDGCLATQYKAYILIEHEYEVMETERVIVNYESFNGDTVEADAWKFFLDFWYNPVDIEVQVIPYSNEIALGIHEFKIRCPDDDSTECQVTHLGSVGATDFTP